MFIQKEVTSYKISILVKKNFVSKPILLLLDSTVLRANFTIYCMVCYFLQIHLIKYNLITKNFPFKHNKSTVGTGYKEDKSSKTMSALNSDSSTAGAREPTRKKRKSSKALFSESILDSEAEVQVSDSNELRPELIPTYDQTYRRVESKPSFKSGATTKPSYVEALDSSSTLNPDKKFFKEKDSDKPYEFPKPSISSKPKRTYKRRPSTTTKAATDDPYSFTSNPSKGRRSSYLQQKRRVTGSSKRRSDKLFSDDEGGDSVKGSPEKSFGDSGLRISDVGDTADTGCEEPGAANSTLQEKKVASNYSARRRPTTPAPVYDYYYDYDYADYYAYEEPQAPAAKFPPRTQQRGRVNILAKVGPH